MLLKAGIPEWLSWMVLAQGFSEVAVRCQRGSPSSGGLTGARELLRRWLSHMAGKPMLAAWFSAHGCLDSVTSLTAAGFSQSLQSKRKGEGAFYNLAREVTPPDPATLYEVRRPALMHCGRRRDKAG